MKKRSSLAIVSTLVLVFSLVLTATAQTPSGSLERGKEEKTIDVLIDGEGSALKEQTLLIEEEILKLFEGRYLVKFRETAGEFDKDTIQERFEALMDDSETDLVIGLGYMTAGVVLRTKELKKPVILAEFFDVEVFGLPYENGTSGKKNLTYLASKNQIKKSLDIFSEIAPFKKLYVLVDEMCLSDDICVRRAEEILSVMGDMDLELTVMDYKEDPEKMIEVLAGEAEAVYMAPSELLTKEYEETFVEALNERKILSFALMGEEDVERGVLVALVPKFYTKFARRIAINVDRIFRGEDAATIPVDFDIEFRLIINARTARRIGVSVPYSLLFDAEILYPYESWGELLTMQQAVEEALENNVNFRIRDEEIRISKKDHLLRWSEYLPDVGYELQYRINDSETAKASAGLTPKWNLRNRFTLSQLIFSDPVITKIINSRQQVDVERLSRYAQELDVTDETSRAYLQYLINKALLKVEAENLKATEHNLEMAKKRNKIGVAGREEIMRWESEVADRQAKVIRAESDVMMARITLNQLMDRSQETPFQEEDVGMELTRYYIGGGGLKKFVKNEDMLRIFIDFTVEKGITYSPELQALDMSIGQQRRVKDTAFRKFWLPEANLDSYLDHQLRKKYYGVIPQNENDDWFVGMTLSYPIFEGGAKGFDFDKQKAEMNRLIFKKELTEQFTELDIRKAVYRIYFSLPNIELSHKSMVSASENYKIMEDKYSKGTASITDLIDAQNEKFTRESQAVISVYEFLQDLTDFDRAVSRFHFLLTDEEQNIWLDDLQAYFADRGIIIEPTA